MENWASGERRCFGSLTSGEGGCVGWKVDVIDSGEDVETDTEMEVLIPDWGGGDLRSLASGEGRRDGCGSEN